MARAQEVFGPDAIEVRSAASSAFARNLYRLLPEDDHDRQPLLDSRGRILFVADVRLDNRSEIASALALDETRLCDAELLFAAWLKWTDAALDRIRGDYAFAIWDEAERALTLVRGPLSSQPIFYQEAGNFIAFASTPGALHALPGIARAPDLHRAAAFVAR